MGKLNKHVFLSSLFKKMSLSFSLELFYGINAFVTNFFETIFFDHANKN